MADRIEVVRGSPEATGPGQPFGGQRIFALPGTVVGLARLAPGAVTPWHHHGETQFFGYVIQGEVALEFGTKGREVERLPEGYFLRIPPRLVHRDVNPSAGTTLIATWCVGESPTSVTVDGPDP